MTSSIIRFLNIILAAMLAGVSFGIWIGFNPMDLSAEFSYTLNRPPIVMM